MCKHQTCSWQDFKTFLSAKERATGSLEKEEIFFKMVYQLFLLVPSLYLVLEPQLLKRASLGPLGPTIGMVIFVLIFLTGRQIIKHYGEPVREQGSNL